MVVVIWLHAVAQELLIAGVAKSARESPLQPHFARAEARPGAGLQALKDMFSVVLECAP